MLKKILYDFKGPLNKGSYFFVRVDNMAFNEECLPIYKEIKKNGGKNYVRKGKKIL